MTLSRVRHRGGPWRGPYFVRMVITGHHFATQTLTYKVFRGGGQVIGSWLSHSSAAVIRSGGSAARRTVVHDSLGWSQNLIKPSFLGAMFQQRPAPGHRRQLHPGQAALVSLGPDLGARRRADRLGSARVWRQRHKPAGTATHHGRRYFSRLAFSFTWRHHAYAGKVRFADPCGNTAGCWVAPGMPVA